MAVCKGNAVNLVYSIYGHEKRAVEESLLSRIKDARLYDAIYDTQYGIDLFAELVSLLAVRKNLKFDDSEMESILWICLTLSPIFPLLNKLKKYTRPSRSENLKIVLALSKDVQRYWGVKLGNLEMQWERRQNLIRGMAIRIIVAPSYHVDLPSAYDDCCLQILGEKSLSISCNDINSLITEKGWGKELDIDDDLRMTFKTDDELEELIKIDRIAKKNIRLGIETKEWYDKLLLSIEYFEYAKMAASRLGCDLKVLPQYQLTQMLLGESDPSNPEKPIDRHDEFMAFIMTMDIDQSKILCDSMAQNCGNCGEDHSPSKEDRIIFLEVLKNIHKLTSHFDKRSISTVLTHIIALVGVAGDLYDSLSCPTCHGVRDADIVVDSIVRSIDIQNIDQRIGFLIANFIGEGDENPVTNDDIIWLGKNHERLLSYHADKMCSGPLDIEHYKSVLDGPSSLASGFL